MQLHGHPAAKRVCNPAPWLATPRCPADSLGRNQEAYEIYTRIESHPAPGVAKKAKRWVQRAAGAEGNEL